MKIALPRGVVVDLDCVPMDFDETIKKAFREYTEGTAEDYMYQDKLAFIDRCAELLHKAEDEYQAVKGLILDQTEFELDEYGSLPDADDFWSIEFMETCYKAGKDDMSLYADYTGDRRTNDKIMKLLERVIKVVINYEGE